MIATLAGIAVLVYILYLGFDNSPRSWSGYPKRREDDDRSARK